VQDPCQRLLRSGCLAFGRAWRDETGNLPGVTTGFAIFTGIFVHDLLFSDGVVQKAGMVELASGMFCASFKGREINVISDG